MEVTKKLRFYAAHRNEELTGKCRSIHGHRYEIELTVSHPMDGSITIEFEEIERRSKPIIEQLDHSLLLNMNDPAFGALVRSGACTRVYAVPFVTSAENMAKHLLEQFIAQGLCVVQLTLRETDSSSVTIRL